MTKIKRIIADLIEILNDRSYALFTVAVKSNLTAHMQRFCHTLADELKMRLNPNTTK